MQFPNSQASSQEASVLELRRHDIRDVVCIISGNVLGLRSRDVGVRVAYKGGVSKGFSRPVQFMHKNAAAAKWCIQRATQASLTRRRPAF